MCTCRSVIRPLAALPPAAPLSPILPPTSPTWAVSSGSAFPSPPGAHPSPNPHGYLQRTAKILLTPLPNPCPHAHPHLPRVEAKAVEIDWL